MVEREKSEGQEKRQMINEWQNGKRRRVPKILSPFEADCLRLLNRQAGDSASHHFDELVDTHSTPTFKPRVFETLSTLTKWGYARTHIASIDPDGPSLVSIRSWTLTNHGKVRIRKIDQA